MDKHDLYPEPIMPLFADPSMPAHSKEANTTLAPQEMTSLDSETVESCYDAEPPGPRIQIDGLTEAELRKIIEELQRRLDEKNWLLEDSKSASSE